MSLARLRQYFVDKILPEWLEAAFDENAGQFVEGLDLDGAQDRSGVVRIRTAARQIYVYAQAASLGVGPEGGLEKAERAYDHLRRTAWVADGKPGFARSISLTDGTITDPVRDLYDHACVLLAQAWLAEATGKPVYDEAIAETLAAMDVTFKAPAGGWAEDHLGTLPRRQNPHMHYFEAMIALWDTGCDPRHAARAGELFGLFKSRFFDERLGGLREFFGPFWDLSSELGSDRLEPGHMAEWVWLIRRYDELSGDDHSDLAARLLDTALRLGQDPKSGFLIDEVGLDGQPLKTSRRLWAQAERVKAHLMLGLANPDSDHSALADAAAADLLDAYMAGGPLGFWRDCYDLDGQMIAKSAPGSSLYHVWSAVAELITRKI
ncbi:AGE family epimerase/isomerase [Rhizobium sp. FKL33]|uniref:AGE family epimerase/isomerase n=1 Tax=Rhizobium sp. FKL33 TaxID=2562307 RepID=UPI0010BFF23B|nr:AGE family epimerase/isomerase [Rhizobium sp. FKL33]